MKLDESFKTTLMNFHFTDFIEASDLWFENGAGVVRDFLKFGESGPGRKEFLSEVREELEDYQDLIEDYTRSLDNVVFDDSTREEIYNNLDALSKKMQSMIDEIDYYENPKNLQLSFTEHVIRFFKLTFVVIRRWARNSFLWLKSLFVNTEEKLVE